MEHDTASMALRAAIAWLGVLLARLGIAHWSDVAAMLASFYTFILICQWCYVHVRRAWRKS